MSDNTINILKQFESSLKNCIKDYFNSSLTETKITLLNQTNYINQNEFTNMSTNKDVQEFILKKMLCDIINIKCQKELEVENGKIIPINYGTSLNELLIEYYSKEISTKYKFDINDSSYLTENIEIINILKNIFGESFNNQILNNNASNIVKSANLIDLEKKLDIQAINSYLSNNKNNEPITNQLSVEKYEELLSKYAKGETTKEEEDLLMNASPYLQNSTLSDEKKLGIANNNIIIYLVSIGLLFLLIIGYIILK